MLPGIDSPKARHFYCIGQFGSEYVYQVPKGAKLISAILIGGGGGGGGGRSGASGSGRGGGGGGAASPMIHALIPAIKYPDTWLLIVGAGGGGGPVNISGQGGGSSGIFYFPRGTNFRVPIVQIVGGQAGGAGSFGGAGTGGTWINPSSLPGVLCRTFGGSNGAAGGTFTGAVGSNAGSVGSPGVITGGAGGAGVGADNVDYAGGRAFSLLNVNSPPPSSINGQNGTNSSPEAIANIPFFRQGGDGGGSSGTGTGGNGGDGGLGAGGGGGGAGVTAGVGGRGGNGLIILTALY